MIIGFSGNFGAGKTSRAKYLSEKLGWPVVNFADSLKMMIKQHFNLSFEQDIDKQEICPKYGITYGKVLQKFGQGIRDIDPDYWLDKIKSIQFNKGLIIGDVRYQNELDWILSQNGLVFHKQGSLEASIAGRDLNHPSEQMLNGYSLILPMESSIEQDCMTIIKILHALKIENFLM